jgi:hypothetical protein
MTIYCMRCHVPTSSCCRVTFTYEDLDYELDLCQRHTDDYDRDMQMWCRMARESKPPAVVNVPVYTFGKVPVAVTDGGVVSEPAAVPIAVSGEISPEAMTYTFTEHAIQRMRKRQITNEAIFRVITAPEITRPGSDPANPTAEVLIRGDVKIVANRNRRRVISVMWTTEQIANERTGNGNADDVNQQQNTGT